MVQVFAANDGHEEAGYWKHYVWGAVHLIPNCYNLYCIYIFVWIQYL